MTIIEKKLKYLNNILPKVNKKPPPRSINPELTPMYFSAMFIGAKNSGKTYGLVKLLKNYEEHPIKDHEGHSLPTRIILFCPTGHSEANPIYKTLQHLDEDDIIVQFTEDVLLEKLNSIEKDKQDIEDYNNYINTWKIFIKHENVNVLTPEQLIILSKYDFMEPEHIPKPKYKYPPVVFMILDDLIGSNECFKKGHSVIGNLTIKHRHFGINLIFTSQNPKSIGCIIRNNIDIYILYRFANIKMVLEKIYEEVSNIITEQQFEELYKHATNEPYHALVIDTHPQTERDKRLKKNFDVVLTVN